MKMLAGFLISLVSVSTMASDFCKAGNFKECGAKLKALNTTIKDVSFEKKFDDVCMSSKKFKCVKKVVRGDVKDEMKYTTDEHKKAFLYSAAVDGENYIYIFEAK
jgi:hypothetical protein